MCPACFLTIGGGLLLSRGLDINNILIISLVTIFLSIVSDIFLRKFNHGKVFFPYQRIVVSAILLFIAIFVAKFLL